MRDRVAFAKLSPEHQEFVRFQQALDRRKRLRRLFIFLRQSIGFLKPAEVGLLDAVRRAECFHACLIREKLNRGKHGHNRYNRHELMSIIENNLARLETAGYLRNANQPVPPHLAHKDAGSGPWRLTKRGQWALQVYTIPQPAQLLDP